MPTEETRPSYGGDGKPNRMPSFQDGRGGSEPTLGMKPGSRYIYYRVYTKDGPLESNHPIYSNDHFISRIASSSVRPPHTSASLMKHFCKIEGLALQNCTLFRSLSEMTALDDSIRLSLRGTTGPGGSHLDPVALVVDKRAAERRSQVTSAVESQELFEQDYEQRYVYYRVYDDVGDIVSKTSFDESNPSLGRINVLSVPPPHTVSSLKNRIIITEDLSGHNVELFEDEDSDSAMNDNDALTLLSDTFPGLTEDQPVAIIYESGTENGLADSEDPNEIQIRELKEALAQINKEFEVANLTHARELEEANRKRACELGEVNQKHARELGEANRQRERELEEANRKHARELGEANRKCASELEEANRKHTRELGEANQKHARELGEANRKHARELVEANQKRASEIEEANRTHTRELTEVRKELGMAEWKLGRELKQIQSMIKLMVSSSAFTKKLRSRNDYDAKEDNNKWHSVKSGEILYTDGVSRKEMGYSGPFVTEFDCYLATNSSGKLAFVRSDCVAFC